MISALFGGFLEIVKKPAILLPALIATLIAFAMLYFTQPTIQGFLFDIALNENLPTAGTAQFPFLFISMYAQELSIFVAIALVFNILGNWLAFCFARYLSERNGVMEAMGFATANLAKAILVSAFTGIVLAAIFALFWIVAVISEPLGLIGLLIGIIFAVLALLAYLALLFLPTAIAIEQASIKEALKKSSELVRKKALSSIVFILIVGLIYVLIANIGTTLSGTISDETLSVIAEIFFVLIAIAYAGIAVPLYYISAQK